MTGAVDLKKPVKYKIKGNSTSLNFTFKSLNR